MQPRSDFEAHQRDEDWQRSEDHRLERKARALALVRFRVQLIQGETVVQRSCATCDGRGTYLKAAPLERAVELRCPDCAGGVQTITGWEAEEHAAVEIGALKGAGKHAEADRLAARLAECQREATAIQERAYRLRAFVCPRDGARFERPGLCHNCGAILTVQSEMAVNTYEVTA